MIKILLSGGLGNQMFQYAAGLALAKRLNTSLAIDLFYYNKKTRATFRRFELDVFDAAFNFNSDWRNLLFVKYKLFLLKHRSLLRRLRIFTDIYALIYEPEFELLKNNTILSGYFQNENYFKGIETEVRNAFTFKKPLTDKNLSISRTITAQQSVSVHIRRSDYVNDPTVNMAVCGTDYYDKAIKLITEKVANPHFYIFSDDMEWVRSNITFNGYPVTFVDWNEGKDSYIDMQLMSLCKHNISTNSSFSWWGAWLNNNPDKLIIMPHRWYKNSLYDSENVSLPASWIRM